MPPVRAVTTATRRPAWLWITLAAFLVLGPAFCQDPGAAQLEKWLKRFPAADANGDGKLTVEEALAYRAKMTGGTKSAPGKTAGGGAPMEFAVDPGWDAERFPEHAVGYKSPEEIKAIYAKQVPGGQPAVVSFPKPSD
ncbi:MAG: hypothetical protein R3F13_19600, partial [Prosthecobacter sp.]